MANNTEELHSLSPLQRALLAVKEMRARLEAVERAGTEPVAIIGLGCRFPGGANTPHAFWRLLHHGVDAVVEVPTDRWHVDSLYDQDFLVPGRMNTREAAFLDGVDLFDATFFGISPREAAHMDPQQRLLLEVAYEALEDAGQSLERLSGSQTGVFVGIHSHSNDYAWLQMSNLAGIDMHTSTGTAHSIVANRLSYVFDWQGPSLAVDTACSSSLVAVHLACLSLRQRECNLALAGGVNLILTPEMTVSLSKMQALSPNGRCRTFDAEADGFARGEGCGVIVLKRLSDALADGDPILALIAGSAVNQDGATNGLTAPNSLSQQAVIRQALANAGARPEQISYIEAHGTGTVLGDPIEVEALAEVLGRPRPGGDVCVLGSVKTNIGHLEGAAGIAGLIKVVLSLQHEAIPPHLHFQKLNPHISLDNTPFVIAPTGRPWPAGRDRHAGVSSFGFGGTNAHVILREAPVSPPHPGNHSLPPHLLPLSARSPEALRALAQSYQAFLSSAGSSLADICYTASLRRSHHDYRLALVGDSPTALAQQLQAFARDEALADVASGRQLPPGQRGLVFIFSGQGTQLMGMGRELLEREPIFRARMEECDALLRQYANWSLLQELTNDPAHSRLEENEIVQPAIFAVQVALADLWRTWGIVPDAVAGHSVGEVAAAYVAGALNLPDAVRVIFHRGRVIQKATGTGKMAAVGLPQAEVEALLAQYQGQVSVAVVNSPASTVLSGDSDALEVLVQQLQAQGVFARMLTVNYPSHSHVMEPFAQELAQSLDGIRPQVASLPIYSTVTGAQANPGDFDAAYWARNLRQPVLLATAVAALAADNYTTYLEIGPHPLLTAPLSQCLAETANALVLASLRRNQPERKALLRTLATLYSQGYPVDWHAFYPSGGQIISLPPYPWQRRRFWLEKQLTALSPQSSVLSPQSSVLSPQSSVLHPLLHQRLRSPLPSFETRLSLEALPFLGEHRFHEWAVLPTTALVEMVQGAAAKALGAGPYLLSDVSIQEALLLAEAETKTVQVILTPEAGGAAAFQVFSLAGGQEPGETWTLHAQGTVSRDMAGDTTVSAAASLAAADIQARCQRLEAEVHYQRLAAQGLHFGPSFQGITRLWRRDGEALAQIHLPPSLAAGTAGYYIHPALLDACLQPLAATLATEAAHLLIGIEELRIADQTPQSAIRNPQSTIWSHAQLRLQANGSSETVVGDVTLYDEAGRPLGRVSGMLLKRTDAAAIRRLLPGQDSWREWLYEVVWQPQARRERITINREQLTINEEALLIDHGQLSIANELSAGYVGRALRELGWRPVVGERFTTAALAQQLGVIPRHHRLLGRLLAMLAEDEALRPLADGWEVVGDNEVEDVAAMQAGLAAQYPAYEAELALLGRCGPALAAVLCGQADPLQLLFPQGSFTAVENLYQDSLFMRGHNALLGEAVAAALAHVPPDQTIRILEIGAGTGGATSYVLPQLPAGRVEYVFSDVSPLFLERARFKFHNSPFIRYELLDIERDPAAQGFEPHSFDLVLAANVLHATTHLHQTLAHVQQLLTPEGLLLLLEVTQGQRWMDLTFGLTEGWWKFSDTDLRPSYPLLAAGQWIKLLGEAGFSQATAIPETEIDETDADTGSPQAVILTRAPRLAGSEPEQPGQWLIFAGGDGLGPQLAGRLLARQERAVLVLPGADYAVTGREVRLDPDQPDHFDRLFQEALLSEQPLRGIVYLWGLDTTIAEAGTAAGQKMSAGSALSLVQALLKQVKGGIARLWLVTRGAQAVGVEGHAPQPQQATLWGLGRVMALEHPDHWGGLIDLDVNGDTAEQVSQLFDELWQPDEAGEDQIAWRDNRRYVPRLAQSNSQFPIPNSQFPISHGAYLITGGLGGLGLKVAHWLAERGAGHLVLTSRTGLPDREQWQGLASGSDSAQRVKALQAIEALGATVTVAAVDVADEAQMAALMARFGETLPPLKGIFHAAAAVTFAPLAEMSQATLQAMLQAKVAGARTLHRLTQAMDLDCFVLFSSTTALWGVHSMAHYAAANCFLDSLAHYRRAQGLPALSVNWGLWEERRSLSDEEKAQGARSGLQTMPAEQALAALEQLLAGGVTQQVVAAVDWRVFKPTYEARRKRPFLAQLEAPPVAERVSGRPGDGVAREPLSLLQRWAASPANERHDFLLDYVRSQVAGVMGYDASQPLDLQQGFFEIGMDSLMAVELKNRLERSTGRRLSATLIFNYPNVKALAAYLEKDVLAPALPLVEPGGPVTVEEVVEETAEFADVTDDELLALFDEELAAIGDLE